MYVAMLVGTISVERPELIKPLSHAAAAGQFGLDVASYCIERDLSVMQHKYDSSQSLCGVLPARPPISYCRATSEPTVKKAIVKVDFFPDQEKKNVFAMRGTKPSRVCTRAGLDSITQQQGNIRAELRLEE